MSSSVDESVDSGDYAPLTPGRKVKKIAAISYDDRLIELSKFESEGIKFRISSGLFNRTNNCVRTFSLVSEIDSLLSEAAGVEISLETVGDENSYKKMVAVFVKRYWLIRELIATKNPFSVIHHSGFIMGGQ